jgi:hypothetical protein
VTQQAHHNEQHSSSSSRNSSSSSSSSIVLCRREVELQELKQWTQRAQGAIAEGAGAGLQEGTGFACYSSSCNSDCSNSCVATVTLTRQGHPASSKQRAKKSSSGSHLIPFATRIAPADVTHTAAHMRLNTPACCLLRQLCPAGYCVRQAREPGYHPAEAQPQPPLHG